MADELEDALARLAAVDWGQFERDRAHMQQMWESRTCWYCQKAMGTADGLFLDGVWECHEACAPAAQKLSGRPVKMTMDEPTEEDFEVLRKAKERLRNAY